MKKYSFLRWSVLTVLTAWAVLALLLVIGESRADSCPSLVMCVIKVFALFSLCLLLRVAHACYKRGLFPEVFQKYIKWCNE